MGTFHDQVAGTLHMEAPAPLMGTLVAAELTALEIVSHTLEEGSRGKHADSSWLAPSVCLYLVGDENRDLSDFKFGFLGRMMGMTNENN